MKHVKHDHLEKNQSSFFALAHHAAKSSVFDEITAKSLNQLKPAYKTYTTVKYTNKLSNEASN